MRVLFKFANGDLRCSIFEDVYVAKMINADGITETGLCFNYPNESDPAYFIGLSEYTCEEILREILANGYSDISHRGYVIEDFEEVDEDV